MQAGKFDRRHARNIGAYLTGTARFLDLGGGIGFIALKARLTFPDLQVLTQDDRPALVETGRAIARAQFADRSDSIGFSDRPLRAAGDGEGGWSGLADLLANFRPDALRLVPMQLPPAIFALPEMAGVARVLLPVTESVEAPGLREAYGPALAALGLTEQPKALDGGSLLYLRS